jgi:hypothetical protein
VVDCKDSVRIYHRKRNFRWLMNSRPVRLNHRKSEFPAKIAFGKNYFLSRPMSILAVQIVDFDPRIVSYPLVLSDLNLEFGKAVEMAPQYHMISPENSLLQSIEKSLAGNS